MKSRGYKPKKELSLRQKIAGSALCLLLYRMLSFVPLPFVDPSYIQALIGSNGSLGLLNVLSGGSLGNMSLMALGIGPWITASIVLQLVGMAFPSFADLNKEEDGKKTYKLITFVMAAAFALAESIGILTGYGKAGYLTANAGDSSFSWYMVLVPALLMMAGTGFLSLMAWYIDDKLFGNGTSLILTTGILCSYVGDVVALGTALSYGRATGIAVILCTIAAVGLICLFLYTVFLTACEKRIPIVYSRKLAATGGMKNRSDIPLKLVSGGVVPVIFASTIITFPAIIGTAFGSDAEWLELFNTSCWLHAGHTWQNLGFVLYIGMIIAFSYFCQVMYVNPAELAISLQKKGATVPGVRPGKPTEEYVISQAKWLTALGGIFLCVIAAVPMVVSGLVDISNLSFLGTSILITVSTISETWKTWESARIGSVYKAKGILS